MHIHINNVFDYLSTVYHEVTPVWGDFMFSVRFRGRGGISAAAAAPTSAAASAAATFASHVKTV